LPSKNMTSDFAPEVAKHSKVAPNPKMRISVTNGSVRAYCFTPLAMQLVYW